MRKIVFVITIFFCTLSHADEAYFPKPILQLSRYFSHHVIIAEKSTHSLYLYKNNNGLPKLVKQYKMATGKNIGDKIFKGDYRTPEGIYHFTRFLTHQDLLERHGTLGEIYGVGAFVMNYPNPIDIQQGKTGGGIWLHSTNDEMRIGKGLDSRGCIVTHNDELINLAKYIELNKTSIIVVHELNYAKKNLWEQERNGINAFLKKWLDTWQKEDYKNYISNYHPEKFQNSKKVNYKSFIRYKRSVFNNPGKPIISLSNISILKSKDYLILTFVQDYKSRTITDTGKKTLYLKRNKSYQWKIIAEKWTKAGIFPLTKNKIQKFSFNPSMRFFESHDPRKIFTKILKLVKKATSSVSNK